MKDQFYITLPSDSSMKYFSENTTTRFTTQLPRHIELVGGWEVALAEIQYPLSFLTIGEEFNQVRLHIHHSEKPAAVFTDIAEKTEDRRVSATVHPLEPGVYTDVQEIIRVLNATEGLNRHIGFGQRGGRLVAARTCRCKTGHYLSFSPRLYTCLGFDKMTTNIESTLEAKQPVDILSEIPAQMFVYCSIVEPRIVGDISAPLLRIIPTIGKSFHKGRLELRTLSPAHYLPVMLTSFRTIEIDIRGPMGRPMPFADGTLTATLHFKRVN